MSRLYDIEAKLSLVRADLKHALSNDQVFDIIIVFIIVFFVKASKSVFCKSMSSFPRMKSAQYTAQL